MKNRDRWSIRVFLSGAAGFLFCKKISILEKVIVLGIAVLYFLIPLDVIPDIFIPFGFLDDFGVLTLILAYMSRRLNKVRDADELAKSGRILPDD